MGCFDFVTMAVANKSGANDEELVLVWLIVLALLLPIFEMNRLV
jgi:hypothetical protein